MAKEASLSSKEKKALEIFIGKLFERQRDNLVWVKLFGSKARGEATKESDVDILIIFKRIDRKIEEMISGIVQDVLLTQNIEISAITLSLNEYDKLIRGRSLFMQTVQKDGIDIWKAA